jgi:hypothetical protein
MLTGSPGHSDYHKFPTQRPTTSDLTTWNTAICRLSSAFLVLTVKLQEYVGTPHSSPLLDDLGTTLHHNMVRGNKLYHKVYLPSTDTRATKQRRYCKHHVNYSSKVRYIQHKTILNLDHPVTLAMTDGSHPPRGVLTL